jgi:hypothetical protein
MRRERERLPEPWPESGERSRASDGSEFEFRTRALEIDPLDQMLVLEIRAEKFTDGRCVAAQEHALSMRMYFPTEVVLLLERAGSPMSRFAGITTTRSRQPTTTSSSTWPAPRRVIATERFGAGSRAH